MNNRQVSLTWKLKLQILTCLRTWRALKEKMRKKRFCRFPMNQIRPHWALWYATPYKVWRHSGNREIFAGRIRNPGLWNSLFNSRNPESRFPNDWIRNSNTTDKESSKWNAEFTAWNPRTPWMTLHGVRWRSFPTWETRRLLEPKCVPQ